MQERSPELIAIRKAVARQVLPPNDPRTQVALQIAVASKGNASLRDIGIALNCSRQRIHQKIKSIARWINDGCPNNIRGGRSAWRSQ